jgi:beta-aspartyl-peptidase (threonine type)
MLRLIAHGGAGSWKEANHEQALEGMRLAGQAGWQVLQKGGSALDAVVATTMVLEDDPVFDAGTGSVLNDHGEVEMDALITEGTTRDFGAVAGLRRIRNPITLAREVLNHPDHRFFIAEGAEILAQGLGFSLVTNLSLISDEELAAFREKQAELAHSPGLGTVGAVAIDQQGNIASATSTGGSRFKAKGRVGDVPIYGAGGYSDNRYGGASSTGVGENIIRRFLAKSAVDLMGGGIPANEAAWQAVRQVEADIPHSEVGVILIDAAGNPGAAHTTSHMPIAWVDSNGQIQTGMTGPYAFA